MPVLTSAENGCGLGDCVRAHELVHIMDLRRLDANVCRVQLAKVIPRFDTQAQHNASEDRAYDESARCLKNKLQLPCTTDECKKAIQTWIDWLPTARIQSKTGAHP